LPKPDVVAPEDLTQNTQTGEIFKLPEVQKVITSDFVVLPCDLVCELDGLSLLEEWMVQEAGLGGATGGLSDGRPIPMGMGGEKSGRRGGLGVWYSTKGEDAVKGEETDFIATTPLPPSIVPSPQSSLRRDISKLVYAIPTDTMNDITEGGKTFPIRHSLLKKHGRIKMYTKYRDAHIYFFPYWVLEMMKRNERLESIGEDVVGWWAKAGWQDGLGDKLGLNEILEQPPTSFQSRNNDYPPEEEINVASYSTTQTYMAGANETHTSTPLLTLASRVRDPSSPGSPATKEASRVRAQVPPILAYVQPSDPAGLLIRRVDSAALLLNVSLRLARLPSLHDAANKEKVSPFAHALKIAHPDSIPQQCRVEAENSLVAENVTIAPRCNIKESIIGSGCEIGEGTRLVKCLLMEGAIVGPFVQLTGCILGRRCKVEGGPKTDEKKTNLKDCEVQEGIVIPWGCKFSPSFLIFIANITLTFLQLMRRIINL
jgi:translation initiation factor eIF-2B subunit gamma